MKRLLLSFLCVTLAMLMSCQKEANPAAPAPKVEETVNSGYCPDCHFITCSNRLHDICPTCGTSRRPPRGCMCISGGGEQPGGNEGEPVPPGTPADAFLVKPHQDIHLSRSDPSQTVTVYYNNAGYWAKWLLVTKVNLEYALQNYASTTEENEDGCVTFSINPGVTIPPTGIRGNYTILGKVIGQVTIQP